MRPLILLAAAAVVATAAATPAWADSAVDGRVLRSYQRDARSPHLFIERPAGDTQWVEVATRDGVVIARVPQGMRVVAGDRVSVAGGRDELREAQVTRIDAPVHAITAVTARGVASAAAPRVEVRGERIFIVSMPDAAPRVAAAD